MSCFSCCCQHFLKLASVFWSLTLMCLGVNFFGFILTEICCVSCVSFDRVGKISGTISFSALSSFSSLPEMLMTRTLRSLVTVLQDSEALFFFFSSLFFLCCSGLVNFHRFVSVHLLFFLWPFHSIIEYMAKFFLLVTVFFSFKIATWIFFTYSICLLRIFISYLRFSVFLLVSSVFVNNSFWHFYNYCFKVLVRYFWRLCHLNGGIYWLSFFHSVWDLSGSWYDEWFSVEIWTFVALCFEILDLL